MGEINNITMHRYANKSGNSGVYAFDIAPHHISIQFNENQKIYTYSYRKAGIYHVEQMKVLALKGLGLSTYIAKQVKDLYD